LSRADIDSESDSRRGLILDERHTLVAVPPEDLAAPERPTADGFRRWLLFRAGPAASPTGIEVESRPPGLWFELGGRRISAELEESAGWGEQETAAVALFVVPVVVAAGASRAAAAPARAGIVIDGREIAVELPSGWLERFGADPPARG